MAGSLNIQLRLPHGSTVFDRLGPGECREVRVFGEDGMGKARFAIAVPEDGESVEVRDGREVVTLTGASPNASAAGGWKVSVEGLALPASAPVAQPMPPAPVVPALAYTAPPNVTPRPATDVRPRWLGALSRLDASPAFWWSLAALAAVASAAALWW